MVGKSRIKFSNLLLVFPSLFSNCFLLFLALALTHSLPLSHNVSLSLTIFHSPPLTLTLDHKKSTCHWSHALSKEEEITPLVVAGGRV